VDMNYWKLFLLMTRSTTSKNTSENDIQSWSLLWKKKKLEALGDRLDNMHGVTISFPR